MFNKYFEEYKNSIAFVALAQVKMKEIICKKNGENSISTFIYLNTLEFLSSEEQMEVFDNIIKTIYSEYPNSYIFKTDKANLFEFYTKI